MKLWIDDVRPAPEGWLWTKDSKTSCEAIAIELFFRNQFKSDDIDFGPIEVSFDHDLGDEDTTIPVVQMIEEIVAKGIKFEFKWHIHSANPVGRKNLELALNSIDRFLQKD